jgi:hypothetical protein
MTPSNQVALDPIVSLAVAMAESPGLFAFLLGSGVSRDAGVPTGGGCKTAYGASRSASKSSDLGARRDWGLNSHAIDALPEPPAVAETAAT